jgi:U3 small nucleolar RNA-associated protein 20
LLEPVVETAVKTLEAELRSVEAASQEETIWERLVVPLQAITSHVGVKEGARLPAAAKARLFASLAPLSRLLARTPPPTFLHALNGYLAVVLPLAVLADVLASSVRGIVEAFLSAEASDAVFAAGCTLASTLDEVGWPLWDTAFASTILVATSRELSAPRDAKGKAEATEGSAFAVAPKRENSRALLARLATTGRLQAVVEKGGAALVAWEKSLGALAEATINDWRESYAREGMAEDTLTLELVDVLRVAPFLPQHRQSLLPLLADLAAEIATTPSAEARVAYLVSPASPAQVLGTTLSAFAGISSRLKKPSPALETLSNSVEAIIANFAWHRQVMHGLSILSLARLASDRSTVAREAVYASILPNLLSEDSVLRRSSLEIALSLYPEAETPTAADLISKCIEVEDMPLTVQGAREKSMKVRRLGIVANGQLGKEGSTEPVEPVLEIILRYLTGASLHFPASRRDRTQLTFVAHLQQCSRSTSSRSGPKRSGLSRSSPVASPSRFGSSLRANSSLRRRAAPTCS